MKIFYSGDKVNFKASAVALGNFDGLHKAHMEIINSCVGYAAANRIKSGVLLFDHHSTKVTKTRNVSMIMPNDYKIEILKNSGVDFIYFVKFDEEFMKLSPEEFIQYLKKYLRAKCICVGYDYRFGYMAKGDTALLDVITKHEGMDLTVTDKITLNGQLVGSTYIRTLINQGRMEDAAYFLGRNFFVKGYVVRGKQNGRKMGFPTANIEYEKSIITPPDGVYAGIAYVGDKRYKAVINIGNNPTFNAEKITLEAHLLDFNTEIYNEDIRVDFVKRIRKEIKFNSIDKLKEQITKDVEKARIMDIFTERVQ